MGVALACCILAYVNYGYFGRYDGTHINAEKIYRINFNKETEGDTKKYGISPLPLKDAISDEITGLDNVIRYRSDVSNIKVKDELFATSVAYVDKEFVELFTIPLVAGSYKGGIDKSKIFIQREASSKIFREYKPRRKNHSASNR